MQVTAPTDALRAAVKACAPAISGRPHMPILGGALVTAQDGLVTVRGFDTETDIVATVNARIDEPGTVLVSHRLLGQILSVATAPTVGLQAEGKWLTVTAGRAEWRLPLMTADAYPASPLNGSWLGSVDGKEFRDAVERVAPGASNLVSPDLLLHTVYLGFNEDTLDLVATDKYRLHTAVLPFKRVSEDATPFVNVPADKLASIAHSLTGDQVTLGVNQNRLSLTDGTTAVSTSLAALKGDTWVNWQQLFQGIKPDESHVYSFDRDDILTAIKQAVLIADVQEGKARHVTIAIGTEDAVITAVSAHDGDSSIPIPVKGYDGDTPLEWVTNAEYLTGVIQAANCDPVQFTQKTPKMPIGVGSVDESPTQIVMPIRSRV